MNDLLNKNVEFIDVMKEVSEKRSYRKEDFGTEQWIPVDRIRVDLDVQREVVQGHVDKIKSKFDPGAFGRLIVNLREDGYYYCTDGQHRRLAAIDLGIDTVPCIVIDCPCLQNEGQSFININESTVAVGPLDKYRVGCTTGLTDWLRVKECVDHIGVRVGSGEGKVSCVTAIYKYVNKSRLNSSIETNISIAKKSLKILNECFGVNGISGSMFNAMCNFVRAYVLEGDTTTQEIIDKLRYSDASGILKRAAEMRKSANRGKLVDYIGYIIYVEYNKNLRKKLPIRMHV